MTPRPVTTEQKTSRTALKLSVGFILLTSGITLLIAIAAWIFRP